MTKPLHCALTFESRSWTHSTTCCGQRIEVHQIVYCDMSSVVSTVRIILHRWHVPESIQIGCTGIAILERNSKTSLDITRCRSDDG